LPLQEDTRLLQSGKLSPTAQLAIAYRRDEKLFLSELYAVFREMKRELALFPSSPLITELFYDCLATIKGRTWSSVAFLVSLVSLLSHLFALVKGKTPIRKTMCGWLQSVLKTAASQCPCRKIDVCRLFRVWLLARVAPGQWQSVQSGIKIWFSGHLANVLTWYF